jgi:NAD(P)H-hydrate epimerase
LTEDRQLKNFKLKFMHTRVVVDALLGSGVTGAPRGFYADIIDVMNRQGTLTVAIDIPTGVNADTGAIEGAHVKADITVTFGVKKVGLTTYPGKAVCGEIVVAEISIPPVVLDQSPCVAYEPTPADIVKMLPARLENGHKGTFGHSVIIGGSTGMGGAVLMAALGSLRIGGGLVSAAVPVPLTSSFEAGALEVMAYPLPFNDFGTITAPAAESALAFAVDKEVIAIGPGLRVNDDTKAFVRTIIEKFNKPIIIDADGLNGLDDEAASLIATRTAPTVVTPHPGELSRMTGASVETIERDRIGAAKHFAAASGAVVVLKGAATVIATPTGEAFINPTGNHGLATGGTGDILTGMIAGLIAQGASATDAAIAAVYIHGAAADQYVAEGNDPRTLLATDLLSIIPFLLNDLAE